MKLLVVSVILAEGTVFARRYRVVRLIAAGAMGAVHEVIHLATERRARARRSCTRTSSRARRCATRFKHEARITATIESEHIVDVFDAGVDEATGMPFLVMELLRGEELGERLKRAEPPPARRGRRPTSTRPRWPSTGPTRRTSCTATSSPQTSSCRSARTARSA